ncbi:hypothetical protein B0H14DRAFT_3050870 [Mycena olivaceomarginata]|nr:hypothetical protein B0H14DRAFT_3050870 [Mycena olivaceomarginata]
MACGGRDRHINVFSLTRGTHILGLEFHSPISALHWDNHTASMNQANKILVGMKDGTVERLVFSVGPDGGCTNACFPQKSRIWHDPAIREDPVLQITSTERALMITTASQIIFKDRRDSTESKYNAADILDWWTQRESNAEVNGKSSAPPTTEALNPSMNQTRNVVGVGSHDEIVEGNNSDTRQARSGPKKIAKTTIERGKAGRRRTLGYVYSDEEPGTAHSQCLEVEFFMPIKRRRSM